MADALDFLRNDAFLKRVNGIVGSNRPIWSEKDKIKLYDKYMSARREELICDDLTVLKSSTAVIPDKASLAKMGIELRDFRPEDQGSYASSQTRLWIILMIW
jgi:hypothetical protein